MAKSMIGGTLVQYGKRQVTLPTAEWILVTPEMAEQWLGTSPGNRSMRQRKVASLTRDMAAGRFYLTGDTVKIDCDDRLMDAHHRLAAISASGVAAWMLVVRGVERRAIIAIDAGLIRTFGDQLSMRGVPNAQAVAAVIRLLAVYEMGLFDDYDVNVIPTMTELFALFDRHDVQDSVREAKAACRAMKYQKGAVLGSLHYVFNLISPERCSDMFGVMRGELPSKDAKFAHALRERLMQETRLVGSGKPVFVVRAMFVQAWNADLKREPIKRLVYRGAGKRKTEFPIPMDDNFEPVDVAKLLRSIRRRK